MLKIRRQYRNHRFDISIAPGALQVIRTTAVRDLKPIKSINLLLTAAPITIVIYPVRKNVHSNYCKRVCLMQNFCLTILTFRVTFTPLTFCVSRDLKFSFNHNFKQLNSIGGNLILKVKRKVRRNWFHFYFKS